MTEKVSLSTLQKMIRDSVVMSMPGSYWVTAEIAEMKENYSGHCYLELIEKNPDGENIRAKARATIWAARYRMLKPQFESATGTHLGEGIRILLKVTVEYHELYGLSLNISDIDPAYTLGEMALRRNEIIRRLTDEGVFDMNHELEFPMLPKRIAVVSSASSAGYTDFSRQLEGNAYGYFFKVTLFNSPMQGDETEGGVIGALNEIANRVEEFDAVAIIRGGGSAADLRWFDSYQIAYRVTQFPLPVITGIGHEKDISVTDMVAWRSLKTPTAAAAFLVEQMHDADLAIEELEDRIQIMTMDFLRASSSAVVDAARKLLPASSRLIGETRANLTGKLMALSGSAGKLVKNVNRNIGVKEAELISSSKKLMAEVNGKISSNEKRLNSGCYSLISRNTEKITAYEGVIRISDPVNILRKGFTITRVNGFAIRSVENLNEGDLVTTKFCDGEIESNITVKRLNTKSDER